MSSLDIRAIDQTHLRQQPCPATKHELAVFLAEEAFDRAVARGDSDTTREIGGVLVGELLRDAGGPYLRIDTTIDALHAEEKGAELTFTHATWEHIHKEMDTRHQGKKVVGWYHTHPGFGVFLSDRDQFIHKSFFNLPFQVAFVYDPKSKEHGLFTWRDNEVWRMRRYAIGDREHTWDGNRASARPSDATEKPDDARRDARDTARDRGEDPGLNGSFATVVMVATVLVLLAGFAGHWFGSSAANATIGQAQIEIAKARSDGAQLAVASLEHDLVGLLRATLGDQAVHQPVAQAIAGVDRALASLAPAVPGGATAGAAAPSPDPRQADAISQLRTAREGLLRLSVDRSSAEALLAAIERATRQGGDARADLARDVAAQRSGIGGLYAELATEVVKAGDVRRAQRLLTTAALLDPGNRPRYEKQLQSFARGATLPRAPAIKESAPAATFPATAPATGPTAAPVTPPTAAPATPPTAPPAPPATLPATAPAVGPTAGPTANADGGTR